MIAPELVKIQKSRISFTVARYLDFIGQYEKSLEAVEEFLERKPLHKRALKLKGSINTILDRLPESIKAYKQVLSLCKPVRDFWERTSLLNSIGSAYWRLKEPELAIRYVESVVRLYEMYYRWGKEVFDEPILFTLWTLAEYQTKSGRLSDAIATYEKSLEFLSKTGPLYCFADPLHELGISIEKMKEIDKSSYEAFSTFQENFREKYNMPLGFSGSTYGTAEVKFVDQIMEIMSSKCKDVTFNVCKRKVCVDQPVPLSVDETWLDSGSNGNLNIIRNYDKFSLSDDVLGYSSWNVFYHRHSRIHRGEIRMRVSSELVEQAKVRWIGVVFLPLYGCNPNHPNWVCSNGVAAIGDNKVGRPDSYGRAKKRQKRRAHL